MFANARVPAGPFVVDIECTLHPAVDGRSFTLSVFDKASGTVLGRRSLASQNGSPPALTISDALELVGGAYRIGSVRVDLDCRVVEQTSSHIVKRARRRKRAFHLATLRRRAA